MAHITKTIKSGVYPNHVVFHYGGKKPLRKWFESKHGERWDDLNIRTPRVASAYQFDNGHVLIWLNYPIEKMSESGLAGIIAHEANHAVSMIFHDLGIVADYENDEAHCYFLQHLVIEIHKAVRRVKKKA